MGVAAPPILRVKVNPYGTARISIFFFDMESTIFTQIGMEIMIRRRAVRNLISVAYTLTVTFAVGKWAVYAAYIERGYEAVGGEYCLTAMVCWIAWKAINYLFDILEDLKYE